MNRFFFLILLFCAEVRENAAAILGVESEAAGGLESGAAAVYGLRTGKGLGTGDRGRDVDFTADLTDRNAGSATLALIRSPFASLGKQGRRWLSEPLVRQCGGSRRRVSWRGEVCFGGCWMRMVQLLLPQNLNHLNKG